MAFQVVEKDYNGTDWQLVRYAKGVLQRYENAADAEQAAIEYLTDINCNNAFTKEEKAHAFEAYMMRNGECFLGVLDGVDWYFTYPKDIKNNSGTIIHSKGDRVTNRNFSMLEGKTEVAVRVLPGT